MAVVVKNANGESTPFTVRKAAIKPAFYAPFADSASKLYVTAVALDGAYVGKTGTDPRVTRGARPGEVLLVFGTGVVLELTDLRVGRSDLLPHHHLNTPQWLFETRCGCNKYHRLF